MHDLDDRLAQLRSALADTPVMLAPSLTDDIFFEERVQPYFEAAQVAASAPAGQYAVDAALVRRSLFKGLAQHLYTWMRYTPRGPDVAEIMNEVFGGENLDDVDVADTLCGVRGGVPFVATYVRAGRASRSRRGFFFRRSIAQADRFRGMCVLIDIERLPTDVTFPFPTFFFDHTLMVLMRMEQNPFAWPDSPADYRRAADRAIHVIRMVGELVTRVTQDRELELRECA